MAIISGDDLARYLKTVGGHTFSSDQTTDAAAAASAGIEQHVDKTFDQTEYREWLSGDGSSFLEPHVYPLTSIYRVSPYRDIVASLWYSGAVRDNATAGISSGKLVLVDPNTVTELTLSSYTTMALLAAAVAGVNGWTMEVTLEGSPRELRPITGQFCLAPTRAYVELPVESVATTNYGSIAIRRLNGAFQRGEQNIFAHYKGGYSSVKPAPLTDLACRIARDILLAKEVDGNLAGESGPGYTKSHLSDKDIVKRYTSELTQWRRIVV